MSLNLNCIMQLKQFYNIATKVTTKLLVIYLTDDGKNIVKKMWQTDRRIDRQADMTVQSQIKSTTNREISLYYISMA